MSPRDRRVGALPLVQQVGEDQLLVLLLVVQPELDEGVGRVRGVVRDVVEQAAHVRVDVRAVRVHLLDGRARDEAALGAAVPFYGRQPKPEDVPRINAPLLIHYAELDTRINEGWPAYEAALKQNNKKYTIHTYSGTQHAFNNDSSPARYDRAETNDVVTTDMVKAFGSWRHEFTKKQFAQYRPSVELNHASRRAGMPNDYVLLQQEIGEFTYRFSAESFFQANMDIAAELAFARTQAELATRSDALAVRAVGVRGERALQIAAGERQVLARVAALRVEVLELVLQRQEGKGPAVDRPVASLAAPVRSAVRPASPAGR